MSIVGAKLLVIEGAFHKIAVRRMLGINRGKVSIMEGKDQGQHKMR